MSMFRNVLMGGAGQKGTPQWMLDAVAEYGIPLENLKKAYRKYSFVTYLESHGNQYINLQFGMSRTFFSKFMFENTNTSQNTGFLGVYNNGYQLIGINVAPKTAFAQFGTYVSISLTDLTGKHVITVDCPNNKFLYDEKETVLTITNDNYIGDFYFLGLNIMTSDDGRRGYMKSHFAIIKNGEGSNLLLLPCLDKNNRPCMLNLMTMQEYYNIGEGEFYYGDSVSLEYKIKELLDN